jgi:hypothetical protein
MVGWRQEILDAVTHSSRVGSAHHLGLMRANLADNTEVSLPS